MLQRRRFNNAQRRRVIAALFAAICLNSASNAQTPSVELTPPSVELTPPSVASARPSGELQLTPAAPQATEPVHSTLEMRIARRPWLLERFSPKPETEPSIKMQPPRPPAELPDPPSISRSREKMPLDDGWTVRGRTHLDDVDRPSPSQEISTRPNNGAKPDLTKTDPESTAPALISPAQEPTAIPAQDPAASPSSEALTPKLTPATEIDILVPAGEPLKSVPPTVEEDQSPSEPMVEPEESTRVSKQRQSPGLEEVEVSEMTTDEITTDEVTADEATTDEVPVGAASDSPSDSSARVTDESAEPIATEPAVRLDYTGFPQEPMRLNNTVRGMQRSLHSCLQYYYARPEVANERSNWGLLHSIMVYGVDTRVIVGSKSYSAIAWIAGNNSCRGQRLLAPGPRGIEAKSGVGLQGHQAQMLAVFSLCSVPQDYPLYAGNEKFAVGDIVDAEMAACKSGEELTFTLIGLSHYLDTDTRWIADDGQRWSIERLIREELSQPIVGAACGGTHRLMGFAHALRKRRAEGKPITGQWKRAELFTQDFEAYCYRLQNRDGSMSTDWFEGREDNGNLDRKIQTTGHMVEWLLTVTPDSQLQNPRLVNAVRFLLASMYNERDHDWKIGPKGHALRSLAMYYERVYRSGLPWRPQAMANASDSSRR